MERLRQRLIGTYLSFDPRSLGLFRIVIGLILLADLYRRYLGLDYWYTDDGIVPAYSLSGSRVRYMVSPFLYATTHDQAVLGMALCAVAYLLFTVGLASRLSQVLALVSAVSLNNRIALLENGGQYVLHLLLVWTLFLPLGRRFSVDALIASLRYRRELSPAQLADREAMRPPRAPVISLAVLALLLQFAAIYFFNVIQKTGEPWKDGSAVYYVLHNEVMNTAFAVWLREAVPYPVLQLFTWGTLVLETLVIVLILSPVWSRQLRLLAILLVPGMHVGFNLCLHLGTFSLTMISFYVLLIAPEHWDWWERFRRKRSTRKVAWIDADSGLCFQFARVFARLDPLGRVRFAADGVPPLPDGVTAEAASRALIVMNADSGRITSGAAALAELIRALPFGTLLSMPLRLPGLATIASRLHELLARNRSRLGRRLRLRGQAAKEHSAPVIRAQRMPGWLRFPGMGLREAAVLVIVAACVGDLAATNPKWPNQWRYRQPELLNAIIWYPRIRQFWRMFAPKPAMSVSTLAVEAVTEDGRTVDPYNEVASRYPAIPKGPGAVMPTRLGQNQFFAAFSERVKQKGFEGYLYPFSNWIGQYSGRTDNPEDGIVRIHVYEVWSKIPPPGKETQGRLFRRLLFSFP